MASSIEVVCASKAGALSTSEQQRIEIYKECIPAERNSRMYDVGLAIFIAFAIVIIIVLIAKVFDR